MSGPFNSPFGGGGGVTLEAVKADADVADAITKKHTQNTDTSLDLGGANPVTAATLKGHVDSTANPHGVTAEQATFTPAGTVAATNVQAAIEELDTEKISALPIGLPDWPVTLYDTTEALLTEGADIGSAVYANGTERYRQTLGYTSGELTSVVYAYSDDSGTTYTDIGTENITVSGTTWTPA